MAEPLVLAELDLEEATLVAKAAKARESFTLLQGGASQSAQRMERDVSGSFLNLGRAADKLEERFFSLRHIAGAVLGGFTVAGAIEGMKHFIEKIIEADAGFEGLKASSEAAATSFRALVSDILNIPGAVQTVNDELLKLKIVVDSTKGALDDPKLKTAKEGLIGLFLYGTAPGNIIRTLLEINDATDKILAKRIEAEKKALGGLIGPPAPAGYASRPVFDPTADAAAKARTAMFALGGVKTPEEFARQMGIARQALVAFQQEFLRKGLVDQYTTAVSNLVKNLLAMGATKEQIEALGLTISESLGKVGITAPEYLDAFQNALLGASQQMTEASLAAQSMGVAFDTMGGAISNAFAGVHQSLNKALGEMMLVISRMAFVYALWNLALAAYASTAIGSATLGAAGPHQFLVAAAIFGAVGVAAGLAARAFGAGQSAGGSGSQSASRGSAGASQAPSQSITINVEGSLMGTNKDELARSIALMLRYGRLDNAQPVT